MKQIGWEGVDSTDSFGLGQEPVACSCEHGKKTFRSIKVEEFLSN